MEKRTLDIQGEQFVIRELDTSDYNRDFLQLLAYLTSTPIYSQEKFNQQFDSIYKSQNKSVQFKTIVIVHEQKNIVVATGTVIIENSLIQTVGHLENIVTHVEYRRLGFSKLIMESLFQEAQKNKCQKIDLFCKPEMQSYYEKIGLKKSGDLYFKYL